MPSQIDKLRSVFCAYVVDKALAKRLVPILLLRQPREPKVAINIMAAMPPWLGSQMYDEPFAADLLRSTGAETKPFGSSLGMNGQNWGGADGQIS